LGISQAVLGKQRSQIGVNYGRHLNLLNEYGLGLTKMDLLPCKSVNGMLARSV
jgi:hypothetical protein